MRARLVDTILLSQRGAALCCVVLVILLGLNALVFYRNTQTLLAQERSVTHSQRVLTRINESLVSVTNAESAQRGYILTGNAAYLRTYTTAARTVYHRLDNLRDLVADNPQQTHRLAALRVLTDQRLADLRQAIDLERTGQTTQAQNIALVGGRADVLQSAFGALTSAEITLLERRDVDARMAATTTTVTLILATAVDAALLAGVLLAIQRTFIRRARLAEERGHLLIEARRAHAAAESAVKVRDDFLSLAAHELRTPLTSVLGNAQLLQTHSAAFAPRDQRLVTAVARGIDRLRALADYLLDVTRLEQAPPDLALQPLDLIALTQGVVAEARDTAPRHTLRVVAEAHSALTVRADRLRLEQVVQALLANAIKYSPDGGAIIVTVERQADHARVSVCDNGIGIPPDALGHVFDRFYRAPNAGLYTYSGLGLGLYVAREIMTHHSGTVTVHSEEGVGSAFTLELPVAPGDVADTPTHGPSTAWPT